MAVNLNHLNEFSDGDFLVPSERGKGFPEVRKAPTDWWGKAVSFAVGKKAHADDTRQGLKQLHTYLADHVGDLSAEDVTTVAELVNHREWFPPDNKEYVSEVLSLATDILRVKKGEEADRTFPIEWDEFDWDQLGVDKPSGESPFSVEGCFLRVDLEKLGEAGLSTPLVFRVMEQLVAGLGPEAGPVDGIQISGLEWHHLMPIRDEQALKLPLAHMVSHTVLFSNMDRKAVVSQLEGDELRLEKWMFNLADSSQQRYEALSGLLADFPNLKRVIVKDGGQEVILSWQEIAARAMPGAKLPRYDPLEVKPVLIEWDEFDWDHMR